MNQPSEPTTGGKASHLKLFGQPSALKIGELLVREGLATDNQIEAALAVQAADERLGRPYLRTVGEILCDQGQISASDLTRILQKYSKQLKLGDILVKQGSIDEKRLKAALQEQTHRKDPLGQILLNHKAVSVDALCQALSRQYNIPYRRLENFFFHRDQVERLTAIIGPRYAAKHLVLPLSVTGDELTVALFDPEKASVLPELRSVYSHYRIQCVLIGEATFKTLYTRLYGEELAGTQVAVPEKRFSDNIDGMELNLEAGPADKEDSTLYGVPTLEAEKLVNHLIKYGIRNNASDIHIEQDRKGARVRFRFDGVLHTLRAKWLDSKLQDMINAVISKIKVMSSLDIAERRLPQDGVFRVNYHDREHNQHFDLDFRVATCPAIVGENITIRILDSRKANVGLDNLNHSLQVLQPLKSLLKSSAGMVLVCGPTGSGKSSTLYAALRYIYHPGIKIITAEDPIEYSFPGIMQTQIKPKINLTFSRLLRSFLRLDPDVILVGEMRDEETAKIGFDAAQTGHLILSTLHTNDAVSAVSRLLDLNIERNQIAASLMGVLAQRLLRRICPACSHTYHPQQDEWGLLFDRYPDHLAFHQGEGCEMCDFTGFRGRTLISELFTVDTHIARGLNRGAGEKELKAIAHRQGMRSMVEDGLSKMDQTTLTELVRVVPHEMIKAFWQTTRGGADGDRAAPQPASTVRMTHPPSEKALIRTLFDRYLALNAALGHRPDPAGDEAQFEAFVERSFENICATRNCRQVAFHLDSADGRAMLLAEPGEPHPQT